eukprot:gb/GFBE01081552.1/.p1 GENE.gb/GFBE01081552.1/~~gb/GFBE01081552.1/.p1  ORF type:complete len:186 (+),score=42.32 gb/GFBE01081552.1/:1-558(+)
MDDRRKLKLWYILALVVLIVLTIVRLKTFKDPHGALLLTLVDFLAVLGLCFDHDYDMQCCKNCGILSFIGAALDVSISIELFSKASMSDAALTENFSKTSILFLAHLVYALVELAWALLCYYVCRQAEVEIWNSSDGVLVATQEEARIYGAALQWTERRHVSSTQGYGSAKEAAESFVGTAVKLP